MESSYELDPEILDNLYKHQLQELREFTLKLDDNHDVNLCRKWLQVFNKTSQDEKVSRNCLCALLCEQLKHDGCLSLPFTDLSNCNRDLTQVLASLDRSFSDDNNLIVSSEEIEAEYCGKGEIGQLKAQLRETIQQRDEKDIQIRELAEIVENCNRCGMEKDILRKISDVLGGITVETRVNDYWIFRQLYAEENNLELYQKLTELDKSFQNILQENTKRQLLATQKHFVKIIKSKEKLLKKIEKEMCVQTWYQKMKVKVVKLQFCSILSRMFIKSRQSSQAQVVDLFNELEAKYKEVLLNFNG